MSLTLREKRDFYDQLAQLLHAGIAIGPALDKLAVTARGSLGAFLRSMKAQLDAGATVGEAFQGAQPRLSAMERATLGGLSRSGRMDHGLRQLSAYFAALRTARGHLIQRLAYPLFIAHLGVVVANLPLIFSDGLLAYGKATGTAFAIFYGVVLVLFMAVRSVLDAGALFPSVDRVLRWVPLVGKMRRAFATSRFCGTYNLQLDAGVNVIDSLRAAGLASRSALILEAANEAAPGLREGKQVGELLLLRRAAFPREMLSAFTVAEGTGQLDQTLDRLTEEYRTEGFARLNTAAEWIPRLLYLAVAATVIWQVVSFYMGYTKLIEDVSHIDSGGLF